MVSVVGWVGGGGGGGWVGSWWYWNPTHLPPGQARSEKRNSSSLSLCLSQGAITPLKTGLERSGVVLQVVPQHLRERAYPVIVRPALEYASAITDPHLSCDIKRLDFVQRHAARINDEQPMKKIWPWRRPSQCDSPSERPWMGRPRHSSQRIKMYLDAQDTDWSRCRQREFEAPILQGQPAPCFAEQAAAHQVQIYHPCTLLFLAYHLGLEPPSPSSEDCILPWGGPPPVTMHERLFLSCTCFYPAPEFLNVLWALTNCWCVLPCLRWQHTTSLAGCQVGDSWLWTWTWTGWYPTYSILCHRE